ncbi:putative signal transducer [Aspergillus clavatus NRRL 1]|uniref:Signal transducer, putative n=1 Tax=Aspergillus clavatus (strain ATCC 1007 / CBS 513.65 / DSM 816 / NCTC 3887 / NRRL 1 / QM 1276 / 107) TaxID=344612 RepID=A1CEB7_ASPCL|nr:signal transducer, putative [Aspergillus clavatus NRRL 1]EAW11216.1 signal transducer, putative [Aspergillus clavatus NRRL 1]
MADDKDTPMEEEMVVESLIQGRARRSTAGRLMSTLLNAEADDDLALLFEEVDDDNEFSIDAAEQAGEDEDMGLDSSSDEEDQGPSAREDDYEGEKEIEKQVKVDRQKRRARDDLRLKLARKKVKIDPTAVAAVPAPRPKKKSERISWLPTVEDGPTRSSSRRQTMQNKELTHARLKDSEEKRIRLIATMEEAAKRKALLKPKKMTQADRLAEAERVERLNSKSLSRWEEMEKRKAEERRAKIEALQNRRLEGPVISYWSGVATWVDGRLTRVGKVDITPKPEKEEIPRKKSKKSEKEAKPATGETAQGGSAERASSQPKPDNNASEVKTGEDGAADKAAPLKPEQNLEASQNPGTIPDPSSTVSNNPPPCSEAAATADAKLDLATQPSTSAPDEGNKEKTSETEPPKIETGPAKEPIEHKPIDEAPKEEETTAVGSETPRGPPNAPAQATPQVPEEPPAPISEQPKPDVPPAPPSDKAPESTVAGVPTSNQPVSAPPVAPTIATLTPTAQDVTGTPAPTDQKQDAPVAAPHPEQVAPEIHVDQPSVPNEAAPQPQIPAPPPVVEHTGRFLTVLENFDEETAQSREFSIYFNAKKPPRLTKISSSLCVITSLPSRYRDPETSLPFANAYAYREIRRTVAQKSAWSPMLGCYVGPAGVAARGVPERFLDPQAPSVTKESEKKEAGSGDGDKNTENQPPTTTTATAEKPKASEAKTPGGVSNPSAPTPPPPATPGPVAAGGGEPMDIDKP